MINSYNKNKKSFGSFRLRANYSSINLFDPKSHNIFQENLNNEKMKKNSKIEKMVKKRIIKRNFGSIRRYFRYTAFT